jgi:hypothetical protein
VPKAKEYVIVKMADMASLAKFIDDLKIARDDAKGTGGGYSAFLALADGRVLQVEIGVPTKRDRTK